MILKYKVTYAQDSLGVDNDFERKGEEIYTIKEILLGSGILVINVEFLFNEPLSWNRNSTYQNRLDYFGFSTVIYADWEYWKENITLFLETQVETISAGSEFEYKISESETSYGYKSDEYQKGNSYGRILTAIEQIEMRYDKSYGILTYRYFRYEETGPNGITFFTELTKTLSTNLYNSSTLDLNSSFYLIGGVVVLIIVGIYVRTKVKTKSNDIVK